MRRSGGPGNLGYKSNPVSSNQYRYQAHASQRAGILDNRLSKQAPGQGEYQGDVYHLAKHGVPVTESIMFEELLPVIAEQHDQRIVGVLAVLERGDDSADEVVANLTRFSRYDDDFADVRGQEMATGDRGEKGTFYFFQLLREK